MKMLFWRNFRFQIQRTQNSCMECRDNVSCKKIVQGISMRLFCTPSKSKEGELVRLSKIMTERGICSRREADEYIAKGFVKVNNEVVEELGTKVSHDAKIELLKSFKMVTILLNKPLNYVSSQPIKLLPAIKLITKENQIKNSKDEISIKSSHFQKLSTAGRLDFNSQGLLVFTQDGRLAKQLIGENCGMEKEYLVKVKGEITTEKLELLRHGLYLDELPLKPVFVERVSNNSLKMILQEGKNRQIRRMCELVELSVLSLLRTRIGNVHLGNLPDGKWRFLTNSESFL